MEENITIEFVRNWIVKHRLTRKSYESVLTDTLTNNGHYYIDNPYLRDWIRENTEMFRKILPYELNDNQQVVLNQLCQIFMKQSYKSKMQAVYIFINKCMSDEFLSLDRNESNQVLAAFAEWEMKEVAE